MPIDPTVKGIEKMWTGFRDMVVPAGASPEQHAGMKLAFYGGAATIIIFLRDVVGSDDCPEDEGIRILGAMLDECKAFAAAPVSDAPRET